MAIIPNEIKYSVIIPAYNAESTINRCLDSLVSQNRQDVQILVIDDGSQDRTPQLLEAYPEIAVISQPNRGVSAARNRGLKEARGAYVLFVDSDDYVSRDYFSQLDRMDPRCDLCYFRRAVVAGKQLEEERVFAGVNACDSWAGKMQLLLSSREIMQLYNKRFKRSIIAEHDLRFEESLYSSEDFNFSLAYSMACRTIDTYPDQLYYNDLSNQESLSRKARHDLTEQLVRGFHYAAATIQSAERSEREKQMLLTELDYLYAKCSCTCIAENFKFGRRGYFRNRTVFREICSCFSENLGNTNCKSFVHAGLRFLLKRGMAFPIYLVTLAMKGRSYRDKDDRI